MAIEAADALNIEDVRLTVRSRRLGDVVQSEHVG